MPPAKESDARAFTRLAIEPDGRIAIGFKGDVVSRAEDIPIPEEKGKVWLTTQCAPTRAAIAQLAKVAEVADERGWFVVARILPSGDKLEAPIHAKPPKMIEAKVMSDGSVLVNGFTAAPDAVRTILPSGGCRAGEAVALTSEGAARDHLFDAAGHLAAAGCEVMIVRRPPGA